MNYMKLYDTLIHKARERTMVDGYTEIHHIIPRSEGGSNDDDNLVELTPKEHFVAHKLMYMDNPTIMSRVSTMWFMSNNRQIQSGRIYEQVRLQFRNDVMGKPKSKEHKRKISEANKGVPKSKESVAKMVANLPDRSGKNNPNYGGGRPIIADGVEYPNAKTAAIELNTSPQNISYRLKSPKWKYHYKN